MSAITTKPKKEVAAQCADEMHTSLGGPQYCVAILEGSDNEGTRRLYVPVPVGAANDFYQQTRCGFIPEFEGGLYQAIGLAKQSAQIEREQRGNHYVYVEHKTPQQFVQYAEWARHLLIPES